MYFSDKEKKRFESIVKYEIITREIKDIDDVVLYDIIRDSVMKKNSEKLTKEEIEEIIDYIKNSDKFRYENGIYNIDKKLSFKEKLEVTNNVAINYVKNNDALEIFRTGLTVASFITVIVVGVICIDRGIKKNIDNENYNKAVIVYKDNNYDINDLYVVYSIEGVCFCNRKLNKVTENSAVNGESIFGFGEVSDNYYRDEIYAYYDVKNGNKVCEDHEDGYYIEKLSDLSLQDIFKSHDYKMLLNEIEQEINLDYLLSREPKPKQK